MKSSNEDKKTYDVAIEDHAKQFGYKAANLLHLDSLIAKFVTSDQYQKYEALYGSKKLKIPVFKAIESKTIIDHLNKHAVNWQDQFQQFVKSFEGQKNTTILENEALFALQTLQNTIVTCFKTNVIPLDDMTFNNLGPSIMVRSTGMHEDKKDMANPGGNKSIPSLNNNAALSNAIGEVAASYISEKSLSQRLLSNDKNITMFPEMPILCQQLIPSTGTSSGVLYSDNGSTRMQSAPGHGEYVVNSKGPTDDYYVSQQNIIYQQIGLKDSKIEAVKQNEQMILEQKQNINEDRYVSSLDKETIILLHEFAKFVAQEYDVEVDIEFIYDRATKLLNIVQVRAIPESNISNITPSSISNEGMEQLKTQHKIEVKKVQSIITPTINKIIVVNSNEEILIEDSINIALAKYQTNKNAQAVKAILVTKQAPNTSHEAGFFTHQGIAVIQVDADDQHKINTHIQHNNSLVLDIQKGQYITVAGQITKEELFTKKIAETGIFASALSNAVHVSNYQFPESEQLSQEPIIINNNNSFKDYRLSELIANAEHGDVKSLDILFSLGFAATTRTGNIIDSAATLAYQLEIISQTTVNGHNNVAAKDALAIILMRAIYGNKQQIISNNLCKSIMISGIEVAQHLEKMESKQGTKEDLTEFFNVLKKFSGFITGPKDSLYNEYNNIKYQKLSKESELSTEVQAYMISLFQFDQYLINNQAQEAWKHFCIDIAKSGIENIAILSTGMATLVKHNLHTQWLNCLFVAYKDEWKEPLESLNLLNSATFKSISDVNYIIETMRNNISNWTHIEQFDELYKNLKNNLQKIQAVSQWKIDRHSLEKILISEQAHQLLDIIDLSIKSLTRSSEYKNEMNTIDKSNLQASRFLDLLEIFKAYLDIWVENSVKETGNEHGYNVSNDNHYMSQLKWIDKFLHTKRDVILDRSQLEPSANFAVNTRMLNNASQGGIGHGTSYPSSLEDIFTLIHQNTELAIATTGKNRMNILKNKFPNQLKIINEQLNSLIMIKSPSYNEILQPTDSINMHNKIITITKNYTLRSHSCIANIKYDLHTKKSAITFSIFGKNENYRWDHAEFDTFLILKAQKVELIAKSYFDKNKLTMTFEVLCDENTISGVIEAINLAINHSYTMSDGTYKVTNLVPIMNERAALLKQICKQFPNEANNIIKYYEQKIKAIEESVLSDCINSYDSQQLIANGYASLDQLNQISSIIKILTITSITLHHYYNAKIFTFDELSKIYDQSAQKFNALTSVLLLYYCDAKIFTFDELSKIYDQSAQKFNALTSNGVLNCCNAKILTFNELSKLYDQSAEKFKALTSDGVLNCCNAKILTLNELSKLYDQGAEKFKALAFHEYLECFRDEGMTLNILSILYDKNKIDIDNGTYFDHVELDDLIQFISDNQMPQQINIVGESELM